MLTSHLFVAFSFTIVRECLSLSPLFCKLIKVKAELLSGLYLFPFTQRKERPVRARCVSWQQQTGTEALCIVWGEKWNKAAAHIKGLGAEAFDKMVGQKRRG